MKALLLVAFAIASLAACAGDLGVNDYPDAGVGADAPPGCAGAISFDPPYPAADAVAPIRAAVSIINAPGVLDYTWTVSHNNAAVTFTFEASDQSQIGFIAPTAGPYYVNVAINGPVPSGCEYLSASLNVENPTGNIVNYRFRTVPPPSLAPPQEQIIQVRGGTDYARDIALDPGFAVNGSVTNGSGGPGIEAYLRFMPIAAPHAFTETFSTTSGAFAVRLLGQTHDVLVVPTGPGLAPKRVTWMLGTTSLVVGAGTAVNGIVRNPAGAGLSGAKVQLYAGNVPSTLTTTAADGTFAVRTDFPAATPITVKVTPPAASGLPRLEATGSFNLTSAFQVNYSTSLTPCDLGGTAVRRGGVNQGNAKVTVVGALTAAGGSVTAGITVNASGTVRVSSTASGSGTLPTTLVPRAPLSAVVDLGAGDFAVDTSVDTSACAAQIIDAPARTTIIGTTRDATVVLPGVRVEATPVGALALADAPPVVAISNTGSLFSIALATGGRYDVRFIDPQTRAAPLAVTDIAPAGVPTNAILPKAVTISGKVSVTGLANPVVGASVQVLCGACTGIDSTRPIAQTATDSLSAYRIAVPDPGNM